MAKGSATSPSSRLPRPTLALLLAIVLVGLAPRAWRLTTPGLTSDEAFSWRLARYPAAEMLGRAAQDVHPPLYYLVLLGWLDAFGEGTGALRGLSVILGLCAIVLAFAVVGEAARLDGRDADRPAGLFAALLLALHATQVLQSRNARMYALGTALALGSAWLLLRAHRATGRRLAWWTAWGLAAAAAVATHYYLLFTVAAQAGWAVVRARRRPGGARELVLAAAVAAVVLAPWAPMLWRQARQVRAEYWIPPATPSALFEGIARWALGRDAGGASIAVAVLVVASLVTAAWSGHAGRFFSLQAAAPWVLGLLVSLASRRPIVLERYMVFAQAFLVCAWAVALTRAGSRIAWVAAAALAGVLAVGLAFTLRTYPPEPPALATAARFLKRQAGESDLVVVESPRVLNKLRYYARQVDGGRLDIRAALPERVPLSPYVSHVVSLAASDAVPADAVFASGASTIWRGRESTAPPDPAPAGWTITYARLFEGGEDTRFALTRYQRAAAP